MKLLNQRLTLEEARKLLGKAAPKRRPLRTRVAPRVERDLLGVDVQIDLPLVAISINDVYRWKRSRKEHRKWVLSFALDLQHVRKPSAVGLIRIGPRALDGDNLQASMKFIRDAIAEVYGVDDAEHRGGIAWTYNQMRLGQLYGVRIAVVGDLF